VLANSDMCALCGGKLRDGSTDLMMNAANEVVVIKKVPVLVCGSCCEAYVTAGVCEKIDVVMIEYRAGKLPARPLAACEIELEISA
jgi:YgiT-type zinc finger domain-containing protein